MLGRHKCDVCAAKDQTIALLADLVDWHRAQTHSMTTSASQATMPPQEYKPAEWASDEEEDLIALIESGALSNEESERALASLQATKPIQLVK
jgi:hypothetical protein